MLGFVSAILPEYTFDEVAATAARLGYDCVELMCWPPPRAGVKSRRYAGVAHVDCTDFDDAAADRVRETTAKHGVAISGLGYYPNPLAADAEEAATAITHLGRVIDAAAVLGVPVVNTFVGRDPAKRVDENWPRFLEVFRPLIERAESGGVNVGIENCPMLFTADEWPGGKNLAHSPAIWRRMFEDIPSPNFGLNYDPSHLAWMRMDPIAPLREFADRIHHVHAKDVRVDRFLIDDLSPLADPNRYHTPKLPGTGDVDWGRFFGVLGDVGYRGPVCVEVEDRAYEGSDERRELALVQSRTFLRNYVPRLP